ncbi:MBL fold metallo-hydrolase [Robbsia andropogonis]|uniref:MBL fold metallo-hydrolase n=1 Tax=Robbsia andropogonis TaxID=28092 RepID=UPI000A785884|nr:MBL fold metallo-hydrolase [Robbsia andropogonis]
MLFRQSFDITSSTYTYVLASRAGGEAVIIDPVKEQLEQYLRLIHELDLRLVHAIDTHTHADHITALGDLRDVAHCTTVMGALSKASCVSEHVNEGDLIKVDGLVLQSLYIPGHTDESFSFVSDLGGTRSSFHRRRPAHPGLWAHRFSRRGCPLFMGLHRE